MAALVHRPIYLGRTQASSKGTKEEDCRRNEMSQNYRSLCNMLLFGFLAHWKESLRSFGCSLGSDRNYFPGCSNVKGKKKSQECGDLPDYGMVPGQNRIVHYSELVPLSQYSGHARRCALCK